jgi:hypothetical protein
MVEKGAEGRFPCMDLSLWSMAPECGRGLSANHAKVFYIIQQGILRNQKTGTKEKVDVIRIGLSMH